MFGILRNKNKTEEGLSKTRQGWFGSVISVFRCARLDGEMWEQLEEALIGADVGVSTTTDLVEKLRERLIKEGVTDPLQALSLLKECIVEIFKMPAWDGAVVPRETLSGPTVILVVGVNGAGKTTSIAKLASHIQRSGKQVILGAADTFRAAAVEQLQVWGTHLGVDVVAHSQGGDPGAVAYDAYKAAVARKADVLIVDTAGRLHAKQNLMDELNKIRSVLASLDASSPHQVILVLDATTGHNGLMQAQEFIKAAGCTGVFLAKLDGTARGGMVVAISQVLNLPVLFIGTGEGLDDISLFDPSDFVEALFATTTIDAVEETVT
jgi:fused signal recognition particle receptor